MPNEHGLQIRTSLLECEKRYAKVSGLRLIQSGSVGRWMAFDPDYCYMVATVAAIMTHHGYQFAAQALCYMIMSSKTQGDKIDPSYSIKKTRLMPCYQRLWKALR